MVCEPCELAALKAEADNRMCQRKLYGWLERLERAAQMSVDGARSG